MGCATPQYAIRQTPVPDESAEAIRIERSISAMQAREFDAQEARPLQPGEQPGGLEIQRVIDRLSRVTERPSLHYRAYLYRDRDPNAAALADGRIYLSTGMVEYLKARGSRADEPFDSPRGVVSQREARGARSGRMPSEVEAELAFVLGHELAHTVAQHLVKRYRGLQQQGLLMALVSAGAAAATRGGSANTQQASQLAVDLASLLQDVANSGYSQEQELEADQLGIRYVMRAGCDPNAALDLLQDFERFEHPWPFLRTHPYMAQRRQDLQRYLAEQGLRQPPGEPTQGTATPAPQAIEERLEHLRRVQRLYPADSVSWTNLQRQIEEIERRR